MNKQDLLKAIVRTIVPTIVGLVGATVIGQEYVDMAQFTEVITALISLTFYTVVRILESKVPMVGILLGWKGTPNYSSTKAEIIPMSKEQYEQQVIEEYRTGLDDELITLAEESEAGFQ